MKGDPVIEKPEIEKLDDVVKPQTEKPETEKQALESKLGITVSQLEGENSELVDTLVDGVRQYNFDKMGKETSAPLTVLAHDKTGKLIGGVYGRTIYKNFLIHVVWVDESARGTGLGRDLMLEAERVAISRGCQQAQVDTLDFQAPDFYQKLGFSVAGIIPAFDGSPARYFLFKRYCDSVTR
ncbi:GCN5-related N-acetyltransferase [Shewanella loihica PV-4]|uniref:GCN5-related N-acetyltransferase n=1 Tax=Shewanella loihica (strain ATCC BAA-1088 / PV-4) TaxID=323850 RepID=A3QE47_SHELP|nr:GCN5-related N-acetyltransferase [Shewanella loihica PV-4]